MKIRIALEFTVRRTRRGNEEPDFEHRDNDGMMIVHHDQPRFIGSRREDEDDYESRSA
jgi:hypothetical protein